MEDLGELTPYFLVLAILVTCSAFFSGTEVAMFSLRRVDREQMARSERVADSLVMRLLARPRRLITTLLIGNEVVNVSVSAILASMAPMLYPGHSEFELALLATATALPILLLLGEVTPKTVAIKTSVKWSRAASRPLWFFTVLVTPVRWVAQGIATVVLWPLGVRGRPVTSTMSEEEFKILVDASSAEGELDARERRFIHRVFEFGDKTVGQVMSPRDKIFAIPFEIARDQLLAEIAKHGYSRVPIYEGTLDHVLGVVHVKDLVVETTATQPKDLRELLHEPLFVRASTRCERLFRLFKQHRVHMALVTEQDKNLVGLVTMEDLLEELFGEIQDEREHKKSLPPRLGTHTSIKSDSRGPGGVP